MSFRITFNSEFDDNLCNSIERANQKARFQLNEWAWGARVIKLKLEMVLPAHNLLNFPFQMSRKTEQDEIMKKSRQSFVH